MSADKRSVATDALETLGTIIGENEKRDAIHLAVEPAIAGEYLWAGTDVGIASNGMAYRKGPKHIGIVDPFLTTEVKEGERFWLVIYPRKITSLRHVWTHPDLPESSDAAIGKSAKEVSEQWLRDFIATADCPDYETVIAAAINNEGTWDDDYLHFNGSDAHGEIPPEFWTHVEVVTGRSIKNRPSYFSCSC